MEVHLEHHGLLATLLNTDWLSDKAVALVVKRRAETAGLDLARYAGYSLRARLAPPQRQVSPYPTDLVMASVSLLPDTR